AAAGDVGADDAVMVAQRARDFVEIPRRARQPVHADEHVTVPRIAPLEVRHAVQPLRRGALHRAAARLYLFSHSRTSASRAARPASSSDEWRWPLPRNKATFSDRRLA